MQNIQTLQEFLAASGAQYRFFDLGRRVLKMDKSLFEKVEANQVPYPYPLQRHAWFGVLFWDPKNSHQHHIWFLKLPLDEQGYLSLAARDDFLRRALDQLGNAIISNQQEDPGHVSTPPKNRELKDNPWSYTPRQDKMATFHAKALVELKHPGSQYLTPTLTYLNQPEQFSQWQHIGLQGIADLCARCTEPAISKPLIKHLSQLPSEVMIPLLHGLENETINRALSQAVVSCAKPGTADNTTIAAAIRALSGSADKQTQKQYIIDTLSTYKTSPVSIEILVAVSGRAWDNLTDANIALLFLEALATNDAGQDAFNQVLTDVLFMPIVGQCVRQAFRSPERSEALTAAIGNFLSTVH
ncbi:MAG: DUF3549 family protein [Pseudomonadales bacterium]|nr:DUF3549 family protein [Pseudomonadales bacterium]